MAKEFQAPEGFSAPSQGSMGQSNLTFGQQSGKKDYVAPGSEGANALSVQIENGGIGSKSEGPASA